MYKRIPFRSRTPSSLFWLFAGSILYPILPFPTYFLNYSRFYLQIHQFDSIVHINFLKSRLIITTTAKLRFHNYYHSEITVIFLGPEGDRISGVSLYIDIMCIQHDFDKAWICGFISPSYTYGPANASKFSFYIVQLSAFWIYLRVLKIEFKN